ncbi:MAG: hypothetical protein AAFO94_04715 [Bacteroidota bacterium]
MEDKLYKFPEIKKLEDEALVARRDKLGEVKGSELDINRFGIALSGGGIRSATINLGFLKTLNLFNILKKADYLSTVSGGGYTGAYIQATLKEEESYDALFKDEHIEYMRSRGEYMIPGTGFWKLWNQFNLLVSFLVSLIMSWISPIIVLFLFYSVYKILGGERIADLWTPDQIQTFYYWGIRLVGGIFSLHFLSNVFLNYNLDVSYYFNRVETALTFGAVIAFVAMLLYGINFQLMEPEKILEYLIYGGALILIGFFANPNALSFHRYYRKQLADAFLHFTGLWKNTAIGSLFNADSKERRDYLAPYPLINTCLNLIASNDENFKGTKASDYFLLSPLFCGSKLTKYVPTRLTRDYKDMTLPAAITISAAAVNPGMGMYSNRILGLFTTIFNARLGFWTLNPLRRKSNPVIWWPLYFFRELLLQFGTGNKMLNISDGGHIENLAVYELLRRKCRLIIAVDAGADPAFGFSDLENLTIRARNELGLDLRFRDGQVPEEVMRPKPSHGYSDRRFAVADIRVVWEEVDIVYAEGESVEVLINYGANPKVDKPRIKIKDKKDLALTDEDRLIIRKKIGRIIEQKLMIDCKVGTFVYVKSTVTAPAGKPVIEDRASLKYGTYKYKIYHPDFPHEPTSDQFFDPIQWESYYQLGQYIAADVIGLLDLPAYQSGKKEPIDIGLNDLFRRFDDGHDLFAKTVTEEPFIIERGVRTSAPPAPEEAVPTVEELEDIAVPAAPEMSVDSYEEMERIVDEGIIEGDVNYEM